MAARLEHHPQMSTLAPLHRSRDPHSAASHLIARAQPRSLAGPDSRTAGDTDHLSARLLDPGCDCAGRRVLDLSAGGMLVAGGDLELGATTRFELVGPHVSTAGLAQVAYRSPTATGLRFVTLDTVTDQKLHDVVLGRPVQALPD
jgi:hypothetical protein